MLLAKLGWEEAFRCYCKLAAIFEGRIYATLVSFSECESCQTQNRVFLALITDGLTQMLHCFHLESEINP